MAKDDELDIVIASYSDAATAREDWELLHKRVADDVLHVEALALVHRDDDGKIHIEDSKHGTGKGAIAGAVGGAVVGVLFPPSLIATALIGAGIGAGAGKLTDRVSKHEIEADVEWVLPAGGSGLVVIFDEQWLAEVEKAITRAEKVARQHVHDDHEEANLDGRIFAAGFRPGGQA